MQGIREHAVVFGDENRMVGVVTEPSGPSGERKPAMIVLNAGVVHHVGPNRLAVRIARRLATRGHVVARFDHCGLGDSSVRRDHLPFHDAVVSEVQVVMRHLNETHDVDRFLIAGICSGAATSFRTAVADERVVGIAMINGGGQTTNAEWNQYVSNRTRARQYWRNSLLNWDSWQRALTGQIQYKRLLRVIGTQLRNRLARSKTVVDTQSRLSTNLSEIVDRGVEILFIHSEGDPMMDFHRAMLEGATSILTRATVRSEFVPQTDHTFTPTRAQDRLLELIESWASARFEPCPASKETAPPPPDARPAEAIAAGG